MKISAIVLTKNEEKNIERAVRSLEFCDEIVIVDDFSTDKTVDKVRSLGGLKTLKVIERELDGDFSAQRNFAMEKAKNPWILFLDADEEVSKELRFEISKLNFNENSYYIKRRDFWWGRELRFGETSKIRNNGLIRLVKKDSGKFTGKVHEEFKIKNQTAKFETLKNFINHYPHESLSEFLRDINYYSTLRAHELQKQVKSGNILEIIFLPLGKFILNYFIYRGFLDGPPGFAYAFLMSFHSFLVRAKLYQYTKLSD